jgi:hypothetical protein
MVSIWVDLNREELLVNWENLQNGTKAHYFIGFDRKKSYFCLLIKTNI